MKLVFMGTPAFAVPTLERLVESGHDVAAVFTQPDRPKGRGQRDAMPPVKEAALRLGIDAHQPERVKQPEIVEQIRAMEPEAIVVVGYGQIISKSILDIPPKGIINVHASLLPKYRGAAPIHWAIARGETRTGVTTMRINEGLDTGDMLMKWETEIGAEETAIELSERLAPAGADLLVRTLEKLDSIRPEPQDDAQATYAPILEKEDGRIDWQLPAREIADRVRGFQPWPGCYTHRGSERWRIWKVRMVEGRWRPGELGSIGQKLYVGCGQNVVELLEIQREGKSRITPSPFNINTQPEFGETLQ